MTQDATPTGETTVTTPVPPPALAARLAAALTDIRATPHLVGSTEEALRLVRDLVGEDSAYIDGVDRLAGLADLPGRTDDPWDARWGVSWAVAAAAETGTLAITNAGGAARATGVTPEGHIVIVDAADIAPGYGDVIERIAASPMPSLIRLTTGPSRSGDIELRTIYGMHGPRTLDVCIIDLPVR